MKAYLVQCDIGGWGHWSTMATCDSEDTAAKWIKERMPSGYCFIIDEVEVITADKVN